MKDLSLKLAVLLLLASTVLVSCESKTDSYISENKGETVLFDLKKEEQAIIQVLKKQEADWNAGNIPSYMEGYWKSDDLRFVGSSGVTKGWQATLERYERNYPDETAMGKLRFEILSTTPITQDVFLLIGKFFLTREIGNLEGIFSLVWKKENGEWVVVADHTSQTNESN